LRLTHCTTTELRVWTGLPGPQMHHLVRHLWELAPDTGRGRPAALPFADRVLLTVLAYRTNLAMRQLGSLFGISHARRTPRPCAARPTPRRATRPTTQRPAGTAAGRRHTIRRPRPATHREEQELLTQRQRADRADRRPAGWLPSETRGPTKGSPDTSPVPTPRQRDHHAVAGVAALDHPVNEVATAMRCVPTRNT
jgi:hypothetical protein